MFCLFLVCCTGNENGRYESVSDSDSESSDSDYTSNSEETEYNTSQQGTNENQVFTCQMCGGSGIMVYFDGRLITCIGCQGLGEITADYLRQKYNEAMSDYYGGNDNGESGNENAREELEREIAWHERNLELIREQQEYIDGSISSNLLRQEAIQEEYEIKRLKRKLNN